MTRECSVTVFATDHEQVVFCHDRASGLRAIIAIYSTALGPGARRHPVLPVRDRGRRAGRRAATCPAGWPTRTRSPASTTAAARPSSSATRRTDKTEALLRAYGRFVESLGGRYVTACDVGTYVAGHGRRRARVPVRHRPLPVRRRRRRLLGAHRLGRLPGHAGLRRAAVGQRRRWPAAGSASPASARSAGTWSTTWSTTAPRSSSPTSPRPRVAAVTAAHPQVRTVRRRRRAGPHRAGRLRAVRARRRAVRRRSSTCSARRSSAARANNQLAHPGVEKILADRGVLYAPDYVVNSGGVIQVADEYAGLRPSGPGQGDGDLRHHPRASSRAAAEEGVPPAVAADRLAERRMAEVGRLRGILVPGRDR